MLNGDFILKRSPESNYQNYDLAKLDYIESINNDEEIRLKIVILIKKILLSSNNSYYHLFISKMIKKLFLLIVKNFIYFCVLEQIFNIIQLFWTDLLISKQYFKVFPKNKKIYRLLIYTIPELLLIFLYSIPKFLKRNREILKLMFLINERYQYFFNNDITNNLICKVNNDNNFDIHIFIKNKFNIHNPRKYSNPIKALTNNIFYDYVIIFSNGLFHKFNYKMCNRKEIEILLQIFENIRNSEIKFQKMNKINLTYKFITIPIKSILEIEIKNFNIFFLIILKTLLLFFEAYMEKIYIYDNKLQYYEELKKEINKNIFNNGYYFDLNNDIVILYRIKEEYRSNEENYNYIYTGSNKLISLFNNF